MCIYNIVFSADLCWWNNKPELHLYMIETKEIDYRIPETLRTYEKKHKHIK
jgi:hypothetical protein